MKKSLWTRMISLLLAVVLCVELLPAVGSAVSPSEDLEHTVEGTVEEPAEVAFEEASLRSERVKHFRRGDGSYVAVQYDVPVHHQDADGRWQDIDNTLEPVGQTYAVEDGSVAFAASLNGDAVFTAGADEHRVQLFLDGDPDVLPSHDATLAAPEPMEAVALPEVTEETAEEPAEETETAASEEEPAAEMMVETGAAAELEPAGPARSYHAAEAVVQEPFLCAQMTRLSRKSSAPRCFTRTFTTALTLHTRSTAKRSKRRSWSTKRRPAISFLSCCKREI